MGSKVWIVVLFAVSVIILIISLMQVSKAEETRRRDLSVMMERVERQYLTDDPAYNRTVASDIGAAQRHGAMLIAQNCERDKIRAYALTFVGIIGIAIVLITLLSRYNHKLELLRKGK